MLIQAFPYGVFILRWEGSLEGAKLKSIIFPTFKNNVPTLQDLNTFASVFMQVPICTYVLLYVDGKMPTGVVQNRSNMNNVKQKIEGLSG